MIYFLSQFPMFVPFASPLFFFVKRKKSFRNTIFVGIGFLNPICDMAISGTVACKLDYPLNQACIARGPAQRQWRPRLAGFRGLARRRTVSLIVCNVLLKVTCPLLFAAHFKQRRLFQGSNWIQRIDSLHREFSCQRFRQNPS